MKNSDNKKGKEYWRSLDQLAGTPAFNEFLVREFPQGASELKNPLTRRNFLTLMSASIALAGLSACRRPVEKIVPYVKAPEEAIPGIPQYFATTMTLATAAYGVVVESHEGRPTKIEGNEIHPSTMGKSNAWMQASVLDLYDPDRSQRPVNGGREKDWSDFVSFWQSVYPKYKANRGEGLAVLIESSSSPTLGRLKSEFQKIFPAATWTCYSPINQENIYRGIKAATGRVYHPNYHFEKAAVILAFDSDFLLTEPENISHTRGFATGRRMKSVSDKMSRLYMAETSYSTTGAMADHRFRINSGQMTAFFVSLLHELQKTGLDIPFAGNLRLEGETSFDASAIPGLAKDLIANRKNSLIVAGYRQPPLVHALVYALNDALGNIGETVIYREMQDTEDGSLSDLAELTIRLKDGLVETLIMLGGNPAYDAPADLEFSKLLHNTATTIHLSPSRDETSQNVTWHIPLSHYLESWGDARAADGTLSLIQPLIAPLYDSHSMIELLTLVNSGKTESGYNSLRRTWENILPGQDREKNWRKVLHDGLLTGSRSPALRPALDKRSFADTISKAVVTAEKPDREYLEVNFHISPAAYDGRFANNGWLQELPDSVTKLTWDNAALISPATAVDLGLKNEDMAALKIGNQQMEMAVWILPGQADFTVSLPLGYGRSSAGRIGDGAGFNTYQLRTVFSPNYAQGLKIRKTGAHYPLAGTQDHSSMEGRPLVREATLNEFRKKPDFAEKMVKHPPLVSLWDEFTYDQGYQWGMSIDLNACTGCNACTIACQSENNIPIIGKEEVKNGREMHWIRIDRYFAGDLDNPEMVHQPVGCQHCEMAPCEQVCPVAATAHDAEGLNVMTYNRCVGTRYCSNNCPFKVRRFNFFNYTNKYPETVKMVQNPDVTVRSRGVMEKCTYCLQRISAAKLNAKNEGREVVDGDIQTACQQACPADAIVFGNIRDPKSAVSEAKKNDREYEMLAELNLKARTSYQARLRNPNPELTEG